MKTVRDKTVEKETNMFTKSIKKSLNQQGLRLRRKSTEDLVIVMYI